MRYKWIAHLALFVEVTVSMTLSDIESDYLSYAKWCCFIRISDFWTDLLLLVVKGQRRSCELHWLSKNCLSLNQELETPLNETYLLLVRTFVIVSWFGIVVRLLWNTVTLVLLSCKFCWWDLFWQQVLLRFILIMYRLCSGLIFGTLSYLHVNCVQIGLGFN